MGIFSRLADIVNSNVNALLDQAEEPEKMVRLIIQEMEETLVEVRSTAARVIADRKEIERKLKRAREAAAGWQRKAELALARDREDLAKGALLERARVADLERYLEEERQQLAGQLGHLETDIVKLEAKLREARARRDAIRSRQQSASQRVRVRRHLYDSRMSEAMERFEKMELRLDRLEGEAEALDMGRERALADEIEDLASAEAVEAELRALKARLSKSGSDTAADSE